MPQALSWCYEKFVVALAVWEERYKDVDCPSWRNQSNVVELEPFHTQSSRTETQKLAQDWPHETVHICCSQGRLSWKESYIRKYDIFSLSVLPHTGFKWEGYVQGLLYFFVAQGMHLYGHEFYTSNDPYSLGHRGIWMSTSMQCIYFRKLSSNGSFRKKSSCPSCRVEESDRAEPTALKKEKLSSQMVWGWMRVWARGWPTLPGCEGTMQQD